MNIIYNEVLTMIISVVVYSVFTFATLTGYFLCFLWVFRGFPSVLASLCITPCGLLAVVALAIAEALKR